MESCQVSPFDAEIRAMALALAKRNGWRFVNDWYRWESTDELADKARNAAWCERVVRVMTTASGRIDLRETLPMGATPSELLRIGFAPYMVEQYVYDVTVQAFTADHDVSAGVVALNPYEVEVLAWGVTRGLVEVS